MRPSSKRVLTILSAIVFAAFASPVLAAPAPDVRLTIKNQAFEPKTLTIPAGQTVKIVVKNEDALPAEFESSELNREKVIPGGSQVPVYVGPLKPGIYNFFNDFYPDSTGKLVVKQPGH